MVVEVFDWPAELTKPVNIGFFIRRNSREAGANMFGVPQVITPNIGIREVTIEIPLEFDEYSVRLLEARIARQRGRYHIADLTICDPLRYGSNVNPVQSSFTDGTWYDDGTGFNDLVPDGSNSGQVASQPIIVTQGASAGGNFLTVDLAGPPVLAPIRPGDMFDVNGFLYTVVGQTSAGYIRFEPDAREDIPVGAVLRMDPPHFYGRLADDNQGFRMRQYLKWGQPVTLTFVEAFDRP